MWVLRAWVHSGAGINTSVGACFSRAEWATRCLHTEPERSQVGVQIGGGGGCQWTRGCSAGKSSSEWRGHRPRGQMDFSGGCWLPGPVVPGGQLPGAWAWPVDWLPCTLLLTVADWGCSGRHRGEEVQTTDRAGFPSGFSEKGNSKVVW